MNSKAIIWINANCRFAQVAPKRMMGYKVMRYVVENGNGVLISGADGRQRYPAVPGTVVQMRTPGVFLTLDPQYATDYYSGLHEGEALVGMEFDVADILKGNVTDVQTEFAVSKAVIKTIKVLQSVD